MIAAKPANATRRSRRSPLAPLAILLAACLALAACSSKSSPTTTTTGTSTSKPTDITIQLALMPPKMIFLGFYVAKDEGFFTRNGLNATLVPEPTGAQAVRAVAAGQGYFTAGGTDGVASADAAGANLKGLWNYGADDMSIIADSKVQTISDLVGKTVGVTDKVGPAYTLPVLALESAGLKASVASYAILGGRPALVGALASGRINAAAFHVDDGLTVVKKEPSLHVVAQMSKLVPQWWYGTTAVSASYANSHPQVVEAFLTAMIQAQRWMYANSAATIAIGVKYTKEDPAIVAQTYNVLASNHLWNTDNAGLNPTDVNYTIAAFKRFGVVPAASTISYDSIIDTHYIDNVLTKLGPA